MESSSESAGSFFQRSIDKVANSKAIRFISSNPSGDENLDHGSNSALSKKQHRRAQVRRAQIEHRQRKEIRVKDLEQEIINLRDLITSAEQQAGQFKHENEAMKTTLVHSNLPTTLPQPLLPDLENPGARGFGESISKPLPLPEVSHWYPGGSSGSVASISFDETIGTSCLHFSSNESHSSGSEAILSSPDIFSFPDTSFSPNPATSPLTFRSTSISKSPRHEYHDLESGDYAIWATEAINFILALEHPCKTHFRPRELPQPNSPTHSHAHSPTHSHTHSPLRSPSLFPRPTKKEDDNHSGHELMASTSLYIQAPTSIFASLQLNPDPTTYTPSWAIPASSPANELSKLLQMSASLAKEDWEITPVQAWFLLVGRLGVERLMGRTRWSGNADGSGSVNGSISGPRFASVGGVESQQERESVRVLERLKAELGRFVDCFGFGAVINANVFWDVVKDFVDEDSMEIDGGEGNAISVRAGG